MPYGIEARSLTGVVLDQVHFEHDLIRDAQACDPPANFEREACSVTPRYQVLRQSSDGFQLRGDATRVAKGSTDPVGLLVELWRDAVFHNTPSDRCHEVAERA